MSGIVREPSSDASAKMSGLTQREEEALRRRLERHVNWSAAAREMARDLLGDDGISRMVAEGWWRQQLDMPKVVLSLADVRRAAGQPLTSKSEDGSSQIINQAPKDPTNG